jgi:AcrR family transcriptional regulator
MRAGPVGHRERIVYETAQQLRRAGVTATGVRHVVAEAGAPRGSFQHYFPGGKDQLVAEALEWSGSWAAERVVRHLSGIRRPSPSRLFTAVVDDWAADLRARDFERGCPVAGAVVDCADTNPAVRQAASAALETWRRPITEAVVTMGRTRRRAETLSTLMLCALEGAIVLARAQHDTAPLRLVARELGPVLDA